MAGVYRFHVTQGAGNNNRAARWLCARGRSIDGRPVSADGVPSLTRLLRRADADVDVDVDADAGSDAERKQIIPDCFSLTEKTDAVLCLMNYFNELVE